MAGVNGILDWLFSDSGGKYQPTSAGTTSNRAPLYQADRLPAGTSSLAVLSADKTLAAHAAKQAKWAKAVDAPATAPTGRGLEAGQLMKQLFGEAEYLRNQPGFEGIRLPSDRQADRLFDRSGYFDPGLDPELGHHLALQKWYERIGLGPDAWRSSPFARLPQK